MIKGNIFNIQKFCTKDGPGIRTVIFFKGCNMNCFWCHNPESIRTTNEIMFSSSMCKNCMACVNTCQNNAQIIQNDKHMFLVDNCKKCFKCLDSCAFRALEKVSSLYTVDEIYEEVIKDKVFYDVSNGGVTLSGGEALLQVDFIYELLKKLKESNINVLIETNGNHDYSVYEKVNNYVNTYYLDIKDTNNERHVKNTRVSNERILSNLEKLNNDKKEIIICAILVNSINFDKSHFDNLIALYHKYEYVKGIKLIKYHNFGNAKLEKLGYDFENNNSYEIKNDDFKKAQDYLINNGVNLIEA